MGDLPDGLTRCIASSVGCMMLMIATALAAAVLYGTGAAVEQRQAAAAPDSAAGRPRLLLLLVRQPLWLLGMVAQIGGFAAHAVALRTGPLATVQMLVAAELVVAVIFVRVWSGRPLRPASWAAALTVVGGSAVFLAVTSSDHRHAVSHPDYVMAAGLGPAVLGGAALGAGVAGLAAPGGGGAGAPRRAGRCVAPPPGGPAGGRALFPPGDPFPR